MTAGLALEELACAVANNVVLGAVAARTAETLGPTRHPHRLEALRLGAEAAHELGDRQAVLELDAVHRHSGLLESRAQVNGSVAHHVSLLRQLANQDTASAVGERHMLPKQTIKMRRLLMMFLCMQSTRLDSYGLARAGVGNGLRARSKQRLIECPCMAPSGPVLLVRLFYGEDRNHEYRHRDSDNSGAEPANLKHTQPSVRGRRDALDTKSGRQRQYPTENRSG
jgi:hypothetical protein